MPKLDQATARVVNKAEGSSFTLVDEDMYLIKLTKVIINPRPDRSGNTRWTWSWDIVAGQTTGDKFKGKPQRCSTGFTEDQAWYPKSIFDAFEVKPNVDTDTLLGKEVCAVITQREITEGSRKGQLTNDLSNFAPASAMTGGTSDAADDLGDDTADDPDDPDF
jgi:hypothetical protein